VTPTVVPDDFDPHDPKSYRDEPEWVDEGSFMVLEPDPTADYPTAS
jgi:hypothetical protein